MTYQPTQELAPVVKDDGTVIGALEGLRFNPFGEYAEAYLKKMALIQAQLPDYAYKIVRNEKDSEIIIYIRIDYIDVNHFIRNEGKDIKIMFKTDYNFRHEEVGTRRSPNVDSSIVYNDKTKLYEDIDNRY